MTAGEYQWVMGPIFLAEPNIYAPKRCDGARARLLLSPLPRFRDQPRLFFGLGLGWLRWHNFGVLEARRGWGLAVRDTRAGASWMTC